VHDGEIVSSGRKVLQVEGIAGPQRVLNPQGSVAAIPSRSLRARNSRASSLAKALKAARLQVRPS
jgi:hypothetical protein